MNLQNKNFHQERRQNKAAVAKSQKIDTKETVTSGITQLYYCKYHKEENLKHKRVRMRQTEVISD